MNSEQLNAARQARWSQNGEARLTLEAAKEWLDSIGFCAYLPPAASAAPFASFVEAVVGRPARVPSAGERNRAASILSRLVESSAAVPLKFSTNTAEYPDFIASIDTLTYAYALRGNRNSKSAPSTVGNDKVTPLALHCWQALQQHGSLDIPRLQQILGQDVTQPAILRALYELWSTMYAFPVIATTGMSAQWELFARRFPIQIAAGVNMGHAEAQSAIVSLYLYAVVAAPEEEVLTALSLLASQSKLREVLRGLGSMRQLDIVDIAGRAHVCLQGGLLPEAVARLSEDHLSVREQKTSETDGPFEKFPSASMVVGVSPSETLDQFVPKKFTPKKSVPRRQEFLQTTANLGSNIRPRRDPKKFQPSTFDNPAPRPRREDGFSRGDVKPWQRRKSYSGDSGLARHENGQSRRPGKSPQRQDDGWAAPRFQKRDGTRPQKYQSRPTQSDRGKPWRPEVAAHTGRDRQNRAAKPWQRKNFRRSQSSDSRDRGPQRTESRPERMDRNSRERTELTHTTPISERRPWKGRPPGQQFGGFARSWPKKRLSDTQNAEDGIGSESKHRGKSFQSAKPGGKRNGKPFWAKPALGGKGSSARRRSNRSDGKISSQKKGGKRK